VGCGTIGTALAHAIERDYAEVATVVAVADKTRANALRLQHDLAAHPPVVSLPELIRKSHLVIEAASASIAARVACLSLAAGRDVLVMSSGGLLAARARIYRAAARSRGSLLVPSGALCGLDGVKAMAVGSIRKITLTTRKPPASLASAPFVRARRFQLHRLRAPRLVFEGTPAEAIKAFPQNTNVAATMTLAALTHLGASAGPPSRPVGRRVTPTVRVIADPTIRVNIHELDVQGDCGRLMCRAENRPSATNPKTSELAIRSALATLAQRFQPVHIGT